MKLVVRRRLLALSWLLLASTTVVAGLPPAAAAESDGPVLTLAVSSQKGVDAVSVVVIRPDSSRWSMDWKPQETGAAPEPSFAGRGWFRKPGEYIVEVGFGGNTARACTRFDGTELSVELAVWLEGGDRPTLRWLSLERVLPSQGVRLVRAWSPSVYGRPEYVVLNRRTSPIYGAGAMDNFFGRIDLRAEGGWQPYPRGGLCGTGLGYGTPIQPGASGTSDEGPVMGIGSLKPGQYRYRMRYALAQSEPSLAEDAEKVSSRVRTVFEAWDEFTTEAPKPPPVEAGRACKVKSFEPDGRVVVAWAGEEVRARLHGAEFKGEDTSDPDSGRRLDAEVRWRLFGRGPAPVCEVVEPGRAPDVKIRFLSRDGVTWCDLSEVLIRSRLAVTAPGDFPEWLTYLAAEQESHTSSILEGP